MLIQTTISGNKSRDSAAVPPGCGYTQDHDDPTRFTGEPERSRDRPLGILSPAVLRRPCWESAGVCMNPNPASFSVSARAVVADLKARFPDTPFLALGQTALWDEPTKAALRRALDAFWPEARLVAGAHDTDYFAKLPPHHGAARASNGAKYVLVEHDDADTRGLWSAAGEMSRLFGSEDVPTQHRLQRVAGVRMTEVTLGAPDPDAFLHEITCAWGWTGIVHAERGHKLIAHDVPLNDVLPTLLRQIEHTFAGSHACLDGVGAAIAGGVAAAADVLRGWAEGFASRHPDASLSDLYRDLFPRLYELLLGAPPANLSTTSTLRLLRFRRETVVCPASPWSSVLSTPKRAPARRPPTTTPSPARKCTRWTVLARARCPSTWCFPAGGAARSICGTTARSSWTWTAR
jgi:hypothetical protein